MTALFNFNSLLLVIVLLVCTCTYVKQVVPSMVDSRKDKQWLAGIVWKFSRVGERLSPYVSLACLIMAFLTLAA